MNDNMLPVGNNQSNSLYYSYIRFFHALPSDPTVNVDIYVNRKLIVENLRYEDFTDYLTAYPGTYQIQIYPTGDTTTQLLDIRVILNSDMIYTAAVIGTTENVELELINDIIRNNKTNYSYMRFCNLSPDTEGVNIYVDDVLVVEDLAFIEITEYMMLVPGRHTLKVTLSSNGKTVVSHPNMVLKEDNYYTTYVVGLSKGRPYIEVLIPLEGTSYLFSKRV